MYNNKNADGYVIFVMVNSHSENSVKNYIDKEFLITWEKRIIRKFFESKK